MQKYINLQSVCINAGYHIFTHIYTYIYVYIYIYIYTLYTYIDTNKGTSKTNGYLISQVSFLGDPRLELQEALERVPITVEPGCLGGLTNQPPGGPTNLQRGAGVPLVDAAQGMEIPSWKR